MKCQESNCCGGRTNYYFPTFLNKRSKIESQKSKDKKMKSIINKSVINHHKSQNGPSAKSQTIVNAGQTDTSIYHKIYQ